MTAKVPEGMMPLTREEADVFERRLAMVRRQLEEIDQEIEQELLEVRKRIARLQERRASALKVYDAACTMLGIDNDLAGNDGTDPEIR